MPPQIHDQTDPAVSAIPPIAAAPAASPGRCFLFLLISIPLVVVAYQGLPFALVVPGMPILVAVLLLLVTAFLLKRDRCSLAKLGLSWSAGNARKFACGFAAGTLLFVLAALLLRAILPFHWEWSQNILPWTIATTLLYHLSTNACEELAFRGYAFDNLIRLIGHWPAQFLIAVLSAMFHVFSGWSWEVALVSTTAGSLLFGLVFVRWQSVPAAIGVHAAWNWSRDLILGIPPSDAAVWSPVGTESWTPAQWDIAQMVLVGMTLMACVAIQLSAIRRIRSRS